MPYTGQYKTHRLALISSCVPVTALRVVNTNASPCRGLTVLLSAKEICLPSVLFLPHEFQRVQLWKRNPLTSRLCCFCPAETKGVSLIWKAAGTRSDKGSQMSGKIRQSLITFPQVTIFCDCSRLKTQIIFLVLGFEVLREICV